MATKSNFTPHEWQQILDSVTITGMAVAYADMSFLGLPKEMTACFREAMAAKDDPGASALVKAVSADFKGSPLISEQVKSRFGIGRVGADDTSSAEMRVEAIEALSELSSLLERKAPHEARAFKTWLLCIAEKVAEASKEGGFLGIGGVRVSEAEKATLAEISRALGLRGA